MMADLSQIHNDASPSVAPELREAVVHEDAAGRGVPVRCTEPEFDPLLATDPMAWEPYATADGEFWPKKGERAVLAFPPDGDPVIDWWEPAGDRSPDVPLGLKENGIGLLVGAASKRGTAFAHYVWAVTVAEGPPPDGEVEDFDFVLVI